MNIPLTPNAPSMNEFLGIDEKRTDEISSSISKISVQFGKEQTGGFTMAQFLSYAMPKVDAVGEAEVFLAAVFLGEAWKALTEMSKSLESLLMQLQSKDEKSVKN